MPLLFGNTASAGLELDEYFKYVSLLFQADTTNNGTNSTFVESSNSVQTLKNGNASQGSFSPFLDNYSVYYDGSGSYTQVAQNTAFQFGTGQFTIEFWANIPQDVPIQAYWTAMTSVGGVGYDQKGIAIYLGDGLGSTLGGLCVDMQAGSGGLRLTDSIDIRGTGWRHIAVTRDSSNTVRLFLDGALRQSGTSTLNIDGSGTYGVVIGCSNSGTSNWFKGNIADYRIVKGSAVYTAAFTKPSAKLTAISGTSFLANRTNRYTKDESSNNLTIFSNGSPKVVSLTPYEKPQYSVTNNSGSLSFDGSGDRIRIGDGVNPNPSWSSWLNSSGSKTGTIEAWVYLRSHATSTTNYMHRSFWDKGNTFMNLGIRETGKFRFYWYDGTNQRWIDSNGTISLNEWAHVAAVLNGSTVTLYINGVNSGVTRWYLNGSTATQIDTTGTYNGITDSSSYASGELFYIGGGPDGVENQNYWDGFISNLRFVPGTQVYTANFTPPTTPLSAISGTALLFKGENANVIDESGNTTLDTYADAKISTSTYKYGSGSVYFDGSGDALICTTSPLYNIGTGDFTVEGWFYTTTWGVETMYRRLWASGTSTANDMSLNIFSDGKLQYRNNDTVLITASSVMNANAWYHVAVVRYNGTTTIYLNGSSVGSTSTNNNLSTPNSSPMYIGNHPALIATWNGYIDDFRVTRFARYTSGFTPRNSSFPKAG